MLTDWMKRFRLGPAPDTLPWPIPLLPAPPATAGKGVLRPKREDAKETPTSRIYFSVSSEGFGHSSRAMAIAKHCGDDEVLIGSYSYALERVEASGRPCVEIPQEYALVGNQGSFDLQQTLVQNHDRPLKLAQIVQHEMALMSQYGISLVVADGRIAPVLAAARLNLPCVVITNQSAFYPFFAQDTPLVQLFGHSFEWVMQLWLSSAEEILIPDFLPPHSVCLPNLSANPQVKKRTRFVGPVVSWNADEVPVLARNDDAPLVVVTLGGHAYRRPLLDAVLDAACLEPSWQFWVLTTFQVSNVPANVQCIPSPRDAAPYFKTADVVITQGGHSTAMELLTLGKPSVVVPDAQQAEQENNASRLAELGVSLTLSYGTLTPHNIIDALNSLRSSPRAFHQARQFAVQAAELQGARQAAQLLQHYAKRLSIY